MKPYVAITVGLVGLGLVGCTTDENPAGNIDPSMARASISFKTHSNPGLAKSSLAPLAMIDGSGTLFHISEVRLHVDEVEVELQDSTQWNEETDWTVKGPFVVDLLSGSSTPAIPAVSLPALVYDEIDLNLTPAIAGHGVVAGDPLVGHTAVIRGTFAYDGESDRNFTIALSLDEIEVENESGINLSPGRLSYLSVSFNAYRWLDGLNLKACLDSGELTLSSEGDLFMAGSNGTGLCKAEEMEERISDNIEDSVLFE